MLAAESCSACRRRAHLAVAVVDARDQLLEEEAGLVLGEAPRPHNAVKELAARCILHHDRQVRSRQKHLPAPA